MITLRHADKRVVENSFKFEKNKLHLLISMIVVYFDQLLGAARTQKLVKTLIFSSCLSCLNHRHENKTKGKCFDDLGLAPAKIE